MSRDYFEVCCRNWPWYGTLLKGHSSALLLKCRKIVQSCHNHLILFLCYGDGTSQEGNHTHVIHTKERKVSWSPGKIIHSSLFTIVSFHDLGSCHSLMWLFYSCRRRVGSWFPALWVDLHFTDHFKDNDTNSPRLKNLPNYIPLLRV